MDQSEKSLVRVYRHQRKNPSFSSSLLDEIYRSIDEGNNREDEEMVFYRETMKTKQSNNTTHVNQRDEEMVSSVRKACLVDKWMEKKSVPNLHSNRSSMVFNSSSSSSDSCCGGGFSSSEAESVYGGAKSTTTSSSSYSSFSSRPKPVRTNVSVEEKKNSSSVSVSVSVSSSSQQEKSNHFNGFIKTKSRALKIYGDLKKVKQPISPGGRLATFLNSLFNAGTPKKTKISTPPTTTTTTTTTTSVQDSNFDRKSTQASTCSSVSSFSRSCLSKTPTSSRTKRSVRFYPVSVIVDEDCRPCGHKCLYEDEPGLMAVTKVRKIEESMSINEELKFHIMEKNRRVDEAARNLLLRNGYQKNKSNFDIRDLINYEDEDEDDDDDDAASCSSSDLFELDNLERYREELPVYETTHLGRNRAIANGF